MDAPVTTEDLDYLVLTASRFKLLLELMSTSTGTPAPEIVRMVDGMIAIREHADRMSRNRRGPPPSKN
jgi:hypothetical protein